MALQLSIAVQNGMLDSLESVVGLSPKLAIFSGSAPTTCASANPTGELARMTLPTDWLATAASGVKLILGSWVCVATGAGLPGAATSFRVYATDGTTCHMQGTCGLGTGDLSLSKTQLAYGMDVQIIGFTLIAGNT